MADLAQNDWSLLPEALEFILGEVAAREATRVVECGSGASTVAIARQLRGRGAGTIHALEHDPAWAEQTRRALAAQDLEDFATVLDAPLVDDPVAPPGCRWYDARAVRRLPHGIDLLLIDGPPASPDRGIGRSRYPALPHLRDRLAPGAFVILDDADRAGEQWVIERWRAELGLMLTPRGSRLAAGTVGD